MTLYVRMANRFRSIRFAAALILAALMLAVGSFALADADPIRVSSLSEPQSVISEQDVSITIKVYNSSQTDMEEEITLFNPDGISVEKYSGLKGEQSVTYTGKWHVTKDQIEKGKINYYIQYVVDTGDGPQKTTRTVPVTIQTEEAAPRLTATYSVSPVSAREGQTVTVSYTLSNTGNIELRNIVVENEGISEEKITAASLSVGEKVTLTDSFVMGNQELVSKPSVTYQAADSKKSLTISDMARKTITVAEDGLEVELKAEQTKDVYPGEHLALTVQLKNTGDSAYSALSVTLSDGTQVASGVDLAPGASFEQEIQWPVQEDGVLSATVSGQDSAGEAVGVISEELTITTQDASNALVLNVLADAQVDTIYSEPAVVRFGVRVENAGEYDATNLTIAQAGTTVDKIPSLPSGESRTVVFDLETSIAGKFQFTVTGRDGMGVEKTYESNILQVSYIAPTPAPTAVPTPTPVPPTPTPAPTATPEPTLGEKIAEHVSPTVLYGIAAALAAALIVVLAASGVSSAKRKKRMAQAIDTIELSPDVRNHRGIERRRGKKKNLPKETKAEETEEAAIVPASELTEEEANRMTEASAEKLAKKAGEASAAAADAGKPAEENRRRRVMEVPADETLRVAPVDQRPEFVESRKVDDSQTRIFGKADVHAIQEEAEGKKAEEKTAVVPVKKIEEAVQASAEETKAADEPAAEATIRLNREQIDAIRKQGERKDTFKKGKPRSEIKPLKTKKGFLFGKKAKQTEEDDLFEEIDNDLESDDDLFE